MFQRMTVAGVGLIGGSLALAAREEGLVGEIVGFGRTEANLRKACRLGIIDSYSTDPRKAARDADLLVLCVPVQAMAAVASACAPVLRAGAIVTDAGSVKAPVARAVEAVLPAPLSFVGAHPIAGGEQSGAAAARADLFRGRPCLITPTRRATPSAVRKIRKLWEAVGMSVTEMDTKTHDAVLARASHLPHVVAFALIESLSPRRKAIRGLNVQSLRDMTRIAASPTEVWSDIFVANGREVMAALDEFGAALDELRGAIRRGDRQALRRFIERARRAQSGMHK